MQHDDPGLWAQDIWRPPLEKYGSVTRLTVALYDAEGRLVCGPINRTSLFDLFAESEHDPGLFAECAARCRRGANAIVVTNRFALAALGTALVLNGDTVGAAVAGYRLSEFPQPMAIERLAREARLPQAQVWDAVRHETPASRSRITSDGELLKVLAETVLREHDRSREHVDLSARLQAANAAKDEFLAMVSHELRGPLNAILGWTRLLRTEHLTENARARALDTIERNAWAQTRLVEDLLDVSQIVAGQREVERQLLALAPIIDQAIANLSPSADAKQVRLDVQLQDDALVAGDSLQLQRIAANLIAALEGYTDSYGAHMPVRVAFSAEGFEDGEGRLPPQVELVLYRVVQEALTNVAKHAAAHDVRVELRRQPDEIIAAIADDGQGFDVEDMMRSRERGLGLFGMQERLALVGGQLVIDSSPGHGTRIHARVPSRSATAFA